MFSQITITKSGLKKPRNYLKALESDKEQADSDIWKKALVEYPIFITLNPRIGSSLAYLAAEICRLTGWKNRVWATTAALK